MLDNRGNANKKQQKQRQRQQHGRVSREGRGVGGGRCSSGARRAPDGRLQPGALKGARRCGGGVCAVTTPLPVWCVITQRWRSRARKLRGAVGASSGRRPSASGGAWPAHGTTWSQGVSAGRPIPLRQQGGRALRAPRTRTRSSPTPRQGCRRAPREPCGGPGVWVEGGLPIWLARSLCCNIVSHLSSVTYVVSRPTFRPTHIVRLARPPIKLPF